MSEHARATATATATELSGPATRRTPLAFVGGAVIGALGGLIGLGGAEFRLPLLIGAFRFAALQAVILNKAMSLVVVASALPFRASAVPFSALAAHWSIIVNLLCGQSARRLVRGRVGDAAGLAIALSRHRYFAGRYCRRAAARSRRGNIGGHVDGCRSGNRRCCGWRCDWHRCRAARCCRWRVAHPYARAAVRCGYQTRR